MSVGSGDRTDRQQGGAGSPLDSHFLGDLDFFAQLRFPNRLQERIGKSKIEDIHDCFLSEEVINTEDRFFREHGPRKTRRGHVRPSRTPQALVRPSRKAQAGCRGSVWGTEHDLVPDVSL